jgi:formylglycine-generating enzyme required for sulfatase activity
MNVRVVTALLCGMLAVLVLGRPVAAEPRVALVIANGDYGGDIGSLKNPVNDGKLIAASLQKVGFKVSLVTNGDQRKMKQAMLDFGQALSDAGPTGTALFYYAGHGIQLNGENYLVPVGAKIKREGDVGLEALSATDVLKELNFAGNKVQIIILDACRNTPFTRSFRGGTFGLAKIDAPIGSFVAYSTAPGSVASDGQGANSPFAGALATELQKPGASIEEMFRNVRAKVIAETDSQQVPWDSSSLTAPFYFSKDFSGAGASAAVDSTFWDSIKDSTDPADFQAYLKKFPNGTFADLAANRIKDLKKPAAAAIPAPVPTPATTTTVAAVIQPDAPSDPGSSGSDASRSELTPPPSNMKPGSAFKDCSDCPDMVVVPAGRFMMGSPDGEEGRDASEGPQHTITIPRALAFSKYVVTLAQYKEFMNATGRDAGASCWYYKDEEEKYYPKEGRTFQDPGFSQTNNSPAVCLNLGDAQAYASWLSKKTGKRYRLPSEAEWEYAARAGSKTSRYWGDGTDNQCTYANGADQSYHKKYPRDPGFNPSCDDGYAFTSPVGSFKPNQFGLYDMLGDAWQFTQDCLQGQYSQLDNNGEPVLGACEKHVIRGGSWGRATQFLRSATRGGMSEEVRGVTNSIRLVREL